MTSPFASETPSPAAPLQISKKMLQALAPLPAVAVQMLAMLDDPHVTLKRIAEVAGRDVGIASAILRMANSAMLGMRGRVGGISDALRLIGTSQARLIVLTCGVAQLGQKELRMYGLASGSFMRHSEIVATLTMAIAREMHYAETGVAYSAGLLHDVGKVIINGMGVQAGMSSPEYEEFTSATQTLGADMLATERACFGYDHPAVGRELAALWALPPEIGDAILQHHTKLASGEPGLSDFVSLANAVAGEVDPQYPAWHHVPVPEHPIVPVEPLIVMSNELLK